MTTDRSPRGDILLTGGPRTGYRAMKWGGAGPPESIDYKDDAGRVLGSYVLTYIENDATAVYGWQTKPGSVGVNRGPR